MNVRWVRDSRDKILLIGHHRPFRNLEATTADGLEARPTNIERRCLIGNAIRIVSEGGMMLLKGLAIQVLHVKTVAAAIVDRYLDSCHPSIGAKR